LSFLCPDPYTGGRTFAVQGKIFSGAGASGKTRPCQGNQKLVKVPPGFVVTVGPIPHSGPWKISAFYSRGLLLYGDGLIVNGGGLNFVWQLI
jgi:hypothetical protein